jgi:hypothetical protein
MTKAKRIVPPKLPARAAWICCLERDRPPVEAAAFLARVQARYADLLSEAPPEPNRALRVHRNGNILPAVAVVQVLAMDGVEKEQALALLDRLLESGLEASKRLYAFWGRFPFFFDMLRIVIKPMMKAQYPFERWRTTYPDLGRDVVALDCHGCYYRDTLSSYGLADITSHFCRVDDYLYEGVSPYIRFERTQTIGRGGELCDFRYYRVRPAK